MLVLMREIKYTKYITRKTPMNKRTPKNDFILDARMRTGLIQKEFAHLVGTSIDTLAHYESGRRQPSPRVLEQVRRLLIDRGLAAEPQSPGEQDMLKMYRLLSPADQDHITAILNTMTKANTKRKK